MAALSIVGAGAAAAALTKDRKCSRRELKSRLGSFWVAIAMALHDAVVYAIAAYVMWILLGTISFVSHLGKQSSLLAQWLPAGGEPGRTADHLAEDVWSFLRMNIPYALLFVAPHSVLRPTVLARLLAKVGLLEYSRLAYNLMAALSLHFFLCKNVALKTPVVMVLPLPAWFHLSLSAGFLAYAAVSTLLDRGTPSLLGVAQVVRRHQAVSLPQGMDAITWMGECVWRRGGPAAFVFFTGVSILPPELTLGDAIIRVCAALYLRARSIGFRHWLERVDQFHILTWTIRGVLLALALMKAGSSSSWSSILFDWRLHAAVLLAGTLRAVEWLGRGR
jgi:hypothetical protein